MTCRTIDLPGGGVAIACSREKRLRCASCGELGADKLCDGPVEAGGELVDGRRLCSKPICARCAQHKGDEDFCPLHAKPSDDPKAEVGNFDRATSADTPHALWKRSQQTGESYVELMRQAGHLVPKAEPTVEACKSCSAPIYWAKTALAGAAMPVDAEPVANGNLVLTRRKGELVSEKYDERLHSGRRRFVSHFATCEHGAEWRRREPDKRDFEQAQRNAMQAEGRNRK